MLSPANRDILPAIAERPRGKRLDRLPERIRMYPEFEDRLDVLRNHLELITPVPAFDSDSKPAFCLIRRSMPRGASTAHEKNL